MRYELTKKEKEARKSSKSGVVKEIKLSPKIAQHDYEVRVDKIKELLAKGFKIKVNMFFRGREVAHSEIGRGIINRLIEEIAEVGKIEAPPRLEGKNLNLYLSPKK